ncbi:hypothetical protein Leryth_022634 [Lithospermum erythrorhizon]|nr:hypothetical protein Leryth_022634 [Lithospermum erythrorhizon]
MCVILSPMMHAFIKYNKLWDEYVIMIASVDESAPYLHKILQNQQIMQFLMGLNDNYSTMHKEKQREVYNPVVLVPDAYAMFSNKGAYGRCKGNVSFGRRIGGGFRPRPTYYYDHCKMNGHSTQRCDKIHGAPKRMAANVGDKSLSDDQFNKLVALLNQSSNSSATERTSHAMMVAMPQVNFVEDIPHKWIIDRDGRVKLPLSPRIANTHPTPFDDTGIQLTESPLYRTSGFSHSLSSDSLSHMQFENSPIGSLWTPHRGMRLQSRRSQSREELHSSVAEAHMDKV